MQVRFDSHTGADVPAPPTALQHIHDQLLAQQQRWADQLARDPASFTQLEPQVHQAFQQMADHLVASLLAHAAQQPAFTQQAKKKSTP
jgi:hypothetical protein